MIRVTFLVHPNFITESDVAIENRAYNNLVTHVENSHECVLVPILIENSKGIQPDLDAMLHGEIPHFRANLRERICPILDPTGEKDGFPTVEDMDMLNSYLNHNFGVEDRWGLTYLAGSSRDTCVRIIGEALLFGYGGTYFGEMNPSEVL